MQTSESFCSSYDSMANPLTTLSPIRFSWSTEVMSPNCCLVFAQRGLIFFEYT